MASECSESELTNLLVRLNQSMKECAETSKRLLCKEIANHQNDIQSLREQLNAKSTELVYFKQNKTIEAYFSKLNTVPDPDDRKRLLAFVD